MMSPETLEFIQKGGILAVLLLVIGGLIWDRSRLLTSLSAKDAIISDKDEKLLDLSKTAIQAIAECRGTLQVVVDLFNRRGR